ncbi:hypothetical protein D4R49_00360 [bacterium]|nr:MAG: hypothetical protein D4R49_00360 [bacterium]
MLTIPSSRAPDVIFTGESRLVYDPLRTVVAELFLFEKQGRNCADHDLRKRAYVRRYCLLSFKANHRVSPDKIQE